MNRVIQQVYNSYLSGSGTRKIVFISSQAVLFIRYNQPFIVLLLLKFWTKLLVSVERPRGQNPNSLCWAAGVFSDVFFPLLRPHFLQISSKADSGSAAMRWMALHHPLWHLLVWDRAAPRADCGAIGHDVLSSVDVEVKHGLWTEGLFLQSSQIKEALENFPHSYTVDQLELEASPTLHCTPLI